MYKAGDYVKIEITNELTRDSEWLWLEISRNDPESRLVFGKIDSDPVVNLDIHRGMEVAVSYDSIREHRTVESFRPN
jgi:hypothetical protein